MATSFIESMTALIRRVDYVQDKRNEKPCDVEYAHGDQVDPPCGGEIEAGVCTLCGHEHWKDWAEEDADDAKQDLVNRLNGTPRYCRNGVCL